MVVEDKNSIQSGDKVDYHLVSSGIIETSGSSYSHTMYDLVQYSGCDFTILERFSTSQEVEAFQIPLMVMSGSHDFGKPPKLSQV